MNENQINRREFLDLGKKLLILTGLAAIFAPVVAFFFPAKLEEMPADPVSAGSLEEFPKNSSKIIRFGRYPAIVINLPEGFRAYSAVCTHFACIVKWDPNQGEIICPCHEGFFNPIDGSVISGPPPSSLEPLSIKVVDDQVFVGVEE